MATAKTPRTRVTDVREGNLVMSLSHSDLGIGKLVRRGSTSDVQFLRAPGEAETLRIPLREIRRAEARANTRAFWQVGGQWRHGRIEWALPGHYRVRASDGSAAQISEEDLFV